MRKILVTLGFVSLAAAFVSLPACGDDDDGGGSAGSGTSGSGGSAGSSAGSGGSAGSSAGSGGSAGSSAGSAGSAGAAGEGQGGGGSGGGGPVCTGAPDPLPPIPKCDDPNASACTKAFCGDTTSELNCKKRWEDCESDPACNQAISCFNYCDDIPTCAPLAGSSLPKALALQDCQKKFETECK